MRLRRRILTTLAARKARVVLTDATFSRDEIVQRLGVAESRLRVIPLALTRPCDTSRPSPVGPGDARRGDPVILFVGSIFNRRHLPELIAATARVAKSHPGVRLEIVGDNRTYPRLDLQHVVESAGIAERTTIREYVSDATLADLYERAHAFVFLSDYEGFGLTPLEALASGVPILVGDTPVAREVYGAAARYVATRDVALIGAELESLLFDQNTRNGLLAAAPEILSRYSWERTARATLLALVEAAR
jgi:glycosyltransferase involved in cell wall biosynthesis